MDQQRKLDLLPSPENGHLHLLSEIQRERSASQDFMNEAEQLEKNYRSSASNLASVKAEIAELTGQNLSDLESARRHEPEPELAGGVVAMEQSPLPTDIGRSNDARSPVVARGAVRGTRQGRRHQEGEDDGTASSPPSAASTKRRGKVGRRLMVRTYTDILREQAKHTSYWEPPAGILIDHTEEPVSFQLLVTSCCLSSLTERNPQFLFSMFGARCSPTLSALHDAFHSEVPIGRGYDPVSRTVVLSVAAWQAALIQITSRFSMAMVLGLRQILRRGTCIVALHMSSWIWQRATFDRYHSCPSFMME